MPSHTMNLVAAALGLMVQPRREHSGKTRFRRAGAHGRMRTSRSSSLPESVVPPVSVVKKLGLQSFVEEAGPTI